MVFASSVLLLLLSNVLLSKERTVEIASSISFRGYLRLSKYFFKSLKRLFKVPSSDTIYIYIAAVAAITLSSCSCWYTYRRLLT